MNEPIRIGVLGGSGVYDMEALTDVRALTLETPFGAPSGPYLVGNIHGQRVAFLARHGRGHTISPSRLNFRANIYGFKQLGVEYLISVNACGSLQRRYKAEQIMVPDQLYDHTRLRNLSFFNDPEVGTENIVCHISLADPFCPSLSKVCHQALVDTGADAIAGGNMITIAGPRFSTKFERRTFASWGTDVIGMTTSPEAQLAREAEMSFAVMAHITDQDIFDEEATVTVEVVLGHMEANIRAVRLALVRAVELLEDAPQSPFHRELDSAIQSGRNYITDEQYRRFSHLIGRLKAV